jgi:cell division protein FtsB
MKAQIQHLEEENKKLKEENEELKEAMKELNNYNKFLIQENERQKSKTITVTDEDNRIILEKGEDGRRHSY